MQQHINNSRTNRASARAVMAFTIVACLGFFSSRSDADILVDLDATTLPPGELSSWDNVGTLGGAFGASVGVLPVVETLQTVNGVTLNGTNYFTGPATPASVTGNSSRTIEAWILNPSAADQETIIGWGRRGGPDGSNLAFNHSSNPGYGAVGHWGPADMGWEGHFAVNRWTYVAYTYDGTTASVYMDGELAASDTVELNTWDVDEFSVPLPFRVGSQNDATGQSTATVRASMTIAKIRVHDTALTAEDISSNFNALKNQFRLGDSDGDEIPDWYEDRYPFLDANNPNDASLDEDTDGLSNLEEFNAGTLPDDADSDDDTLSDFAELNRTVGGNPAPTDPLKKDTDNDGLDDNVETGTGIFVDATNTGSNPLDADSDDDTYGDGQEVSAGSDPNNPASTPVSGLPLVDLDASLLASGPLANWTNIGTIGGVFVSTNTTVPSVVTILGNKGVNINPSGSSQFYTGPAAPAFVCGNNSRTVEAWIYNPVVGTDWDTIIAWGRRDSLANCAFGHGNNAGAGAVGHFGGPDLGWLSGQTVAAQWVYVVYTWDASNRVTRIYSNGVEANSETNAANINTATLDTLSRPLPFRLCAQNDPNGNVNTSRGGALIIGEVRVYDRLFDASMIESNYLAGSSKYGQIDYDNDGMPTWYERQYGLNETNAADAALDLDNDGLSNLTEYQMGTTPNVSDTDGDGVSDGDEVNRPGGATNPLRWDTDQDGLSDGAEATTDPLNPDSDADFYPDGQEVLHGSLPNNSSSVPDFNTPVPLINLDATTLPLGARLVWTNNTVLGGVFTAPTSAIPNVEVVAGVKGVTLNGINQHYTKPSAPVFVGGIASRTVEAWIFNPTAGDQETVIAWGRRGGPVGSNAAFGHGTNAQSGAIGQWTAIPDVGWGDPTNVVSGAWTYVVYVYDDAISTASVYRNGILANSETFDPFTVTTHITDTTGSPLPFRIGAQNEADGSPSSTGLASLTIAKLRVYDQALNDTTIAATYNVEKEQFASPPPSLAIAVNKQDGTATLTWDASAGKTYSILGSTNLVNWDVIASELSTNTFSDSIVTGGKFYRLQVQ